MSTFNGIVSEFPLIRIDYFRTKPSQRPPLACFLSHVHSDHLQGLNTLKSPFIFCSPATRRLLLRIEKYPHRMNFAKGILEVRKQTYRHLQLILKAIPLQTPTEIELGAQMRIRVTLFDAHHCPGAVMFLIEGGGKAILYTGDVRAEAWWVNSLIRNPVLIPYTLGEKRLDCMYLDTTFAAKDDVYQDFPSKAAGLQELLQKVQRCPPDTVFYFRAWTLGYEDVWVALSAALGSKIHVDGYQSRLYRSLSDDSRDEFSVAEGPVLNGFQAGNHFQTGCLTTDSGGVRIHSCEPGTVCHGGLSKNKDVIWIIPIVTRTRDGADVYEIGAGGGGRDLYQAAEVDVTDLASTEALASLCAEWIKDPAELSNALQRLSSAQMSRNSKMSLDDLGLDSDERISLKELVSRMASCGDHKRNGGEGTGLPGLNVSNGPPSAEAMHFPYSRHASYNELRHLVSAFKPRDICPCTVDEESWSEAVSMKTLFGDLCSENRFEHDREWRTRVREKKDRDEIAGGKKRKREDEHDTQESESSRGAYETANVSFEMHATESGIPISVTRRPSSEDCRHATKTAGQHQTANIKTSTTGKRESHVDISAHEEANPGQLAVTDEPRAVNPVQEPSRILENPGGSSFIDLTNDEEPGSPPNPRLEAIKSAFEAITRDSDPGLGDLLRRPDEVIAIREGNSLEREALENQELQSALQAGVIEAIRKPESQTSVATSAFGSQPRMDDTQDEGLSGLQLDRTSQDQAELLQYNDHSGKALRTYAIKEAYRAARRCLLDGADTGGWEDLSLRSVGRRGHTEAEMEL